MSAQFAVAHVSRRNLLAAVGRAAKVSPARVLPGKEVLKTLRLEVNGHVTVQTTDRDMGYAECVPDDGREGEAVALVDARKLAALLKKIPGSPDDMMRVEVNGRVRLACGHVEYILPTDQNPEEFPPFNPATGEHYVSVSGADLARGLSAVAPFTDVESTRYALGGVLVEWRADGKLTFAATDSRRLAVIDVPASGTSPAWTASGSAERRWEKPANVVIPAKAVAAIVEACDPAESVRLAYRVSERREGATVHRSEWFAAEGNEWSLVTQLVEGRFPMYRQVIPAESPGEVTFDAGKAVKALEAVKVCSSDESRGCDVTFPGDVMTFACKSVDYGAARAEIPADYRGEVRADGATYDPVYLLEWLKTLPKGAAVRLEFTDHKSQAVFRADHAAAYVLMPLSRDRD